MHLFQWTVTKCFILENISECYCSGNMVTLSLTSLPHYNNSRSSARTSVVHTNVPMQIEFAYFCLIFFLKKARRRVNDVVEKCHNDAHWVIVIHTKSTFMTGLYRACVIRTILSLKKTTWAFLNNNGGYVFSTYQGWQKWKDFQL